MVAATFNPSETVIKLSRVPARFGFSRRTVETWIEHGLETWQPGGFGVPITTLEAISRFMIPVQPTRREELPRVPSAKADIDAFLAME